MTRGEIESALIKIRGVWVVIYIDPDHNWRAAGHDRYDDADRAAFAAGDWRYVNVTVALHEHPSITASVGTVEWGAMPTADIGLSHVVNTHVPELVSALRGKLTALLDTWQEEMSVHDFPHTPSVGRPRDAADQQMLDGGVRRELA